MGNQYSITPAGDMSQGLQGLGSVLQYATQQKEERDALEKERAEKALGQAELLDAYKLGDANAIAEVSIKHPWISQQANQALGLVQDFQKKEATDYALSVLSNPDQAEALTERRLQLLAMPGADSTKVRDPTHTAGIYDRMMKGDKAGALQDIRNTFATINPEAFKAYQAAQGGGEEGFTLGKDDIRFDAAGNVVARGVAPPEKEQDQFQVLSPQEAQQMGLPATGSFKINKNTGEVSAIGGAQTVVNNNMGQTTEGERTAGILANRLDFAKSQIDDMLKQSPEAQSPGAIPTMLEGAGMNYLARVSNPAERQIIEAAQEDMLDAALTLGTGAAYAKEQLQGYKKSYFPQLGDDQKTIEAKAVRLKNLIDAAYTKAGRGAPSTRRSGQDIATVASQADFDALPSGAIYIEDGQQYRKP